MRNVLFLLLGFLVLFIIWSPMRTPYVDIFWENLKETIHFCFTFIYPVGVELGLWEGNCFFISSKKLHPCDIEKLGTELFEKKLITKEDFEKIILIIETIYKCTFHYGYYEKVDGKIKIFFIPNLIENYSRNISIPISSFNLRNSPYVMVIFDNNHCQIENLYSYLYRSKQGVHFPSIKNENELLLKNYISKYYLIPILDYYGIEDNYLPNFQDKLDDIVTTYFVGGYHILIFHNIDGKCFKEKKIKKILISINTFYNEIFNIAIVNEKR